MEMTADSSPMRKGQPNPASQMSERLLFLAILALFLGLGLWYSLATPPFETPDELYHYAFVRHLAAGHGLPVQNPAVEEAWSHEGSQAPLYYLVAGWLTSGIDQDDFDQLNVRNPRANIGDPLFPGNKNFMLYSAATRPLQGSNLALHVARWLSLALGGLTLGLIYQIARLALADDAQLNKGWPLALLPVLWVATMPQFTFISAACSNDSMVIVTTTATIYWLARLLAKATDKPIALLEWIFLGVFVGLAALSKLQGLGLLPLVAVATLLIAAVRKDWRLPFRAVLPVTMPMLLVAGWWYWRNYSLYGDWFGITNLLSNNGLRPEPITWGSFWGEFRGLRYSFWGIFGWFNILLPTWVYGVLDGVTLVALAGLPLAWFSRRRTDHEQDANGWQRARLVRLLLLSWLLISVALLLYWLNQATSSQGRLFFPALSAFAVLLVFGLHAWVRYLPTRVQPMLWSLTPVLMAGCSLYTLTVLFPASYSAPKPISAIPATAQPLDVVYGETDQIALLALAIPNERFQPGDRVPVTLYLQAQAPIQDDYQLFIQLLNENRLEIGNLTSHPGWGRNPTRLWQPGAIYADHYPVLIERAISGASPLLAQVYIGFVDPQTEKGDRLPIPAQTTAGVKIEEGPFLGQVAISPSRPPVIDLTTMTANGAQFGNVIELTAVDLPAQVAVGGTEPITVTLLWDAIGTPATDYTAFVHLVDKGAQRVSGFDQAPALRFPTRYWRTGDRIVTQFTLMPPTSAGDFTFWAGLYEAESGGTLLLPVTESASQVTGDGRVMIGKLTVK